MQAVLKKILNANSIEQLWEILCTCMDSYGFDRLLYGYTHFRTPQNFGDPNDLLILSNLENDYVEQFIDSGMYTDGPMFEWAKDNYGACSWRWIDEKARNHGLTAKEKKVVAFNQSHNLDAGYTVSFRDTSVRAKGAISLVAKVGMSQDKVDEIWMEHGADLEIINTVAHLKIINLPYSGSRRHLTKRQREALEWVGDGKTTQDIAQIMGLTSATVEKHLRLAREVLDVETTAQAVLKASFQNQIFISDI